MAFVLQLVKIKRMGIVNQVNTCVSTRNCGFAQDFDKQEPNVGPGLMSQIENTH